MCVPIIRTLICTLPIPPVIGKSLLLFKIVKMPHDMCLLQRERRGDKTLEKIVGRRSGSRGMGSHRGYRDRQRF